VSVNYHTLSDFRVAHPELLDGLLTRSVAALLGEGLVTLRRVAFDGMRVRASAGADTFRRRPTLEQLLAEAEDQVAALRRGEGAARERVERVRSALAAMPGLEAAREGFKPGTRGKARASTTDPEPRVMKTADGGFRPAYNVHFATDAGTGLVVLAGATNQGT